MDEDRRRHLSQPTRPPEDAQEEHACLVADAAVVGVDPEAAVDLAERLGGAMGLPRAYRAVDRRIAVGYTLPETEAMLGSGARSTPGDQATLNGTRDAPRRSPSPGSTA